MEDRRKSKGAEKFVPWEPYRGAVNKPGTLKTSNSQPKIAKPDEKTLVKIKYKMEPLSRKSSAKAQEFAGEGCENAETEPVLSSVKNVAEHFEQNGEKTESSNAEQLELKLERLATELEKTQLEKKALEDQLNIQLKVNEELKRLVVASMGEDLQEHLSSLSNDKVRLAQNLVSFSRRLSEGNENQQQLVIDGDIWRSKFLASSLMVDELVGWRHFLIGQLEAAQSCLLQMMEEHQVYRQHLFQTALLVLEMKEAFDPLEANVHRRLLTIHSLYDLVTGIHSMVDNLHNRLLAGRKHDLLQSKPEAAYSNAEKLAQKILKIETEKFYRSSDYYEDLPGSREKRLRHLGSLDLSQRNMTVNCCKKCAGQIKVV